MKFVVAIKMPYGYYSGEHAGTVLSVHRVILTARKSIRKQDDPECCAIYPIHDAGVSKGDIIDIGKYPEVS